MFRALPRPLCALLLIGVLALTSACDGGDLAKNGSLCMAGVGITYVIEAVSGGTATPAVAIVGGIAATFCANAIGDITSPDATATASAGAAPGEPTTTTAQYNIQGGESSAVALSVQSTVPFQNCQNPNPLSQDTVTMQLSVKVVLTVGDRQFESTPSPSDQDPNAAIALELIQRAHIEVGSKLTSPVTFTVSLPAHTEATITEPTLNVKMMIGTASFQQSGGSSKLSTKWAYPVDLSISGQPSVGKPTLCA